MSSRTIRPIPQLKEVLTGLGAGIRTIYRFSPTQWFAWPYDVDAIPSPVVGDNVRRTMWTGDGEPKMTTTTIMGAFVGPGVPVSRRLGIPAPENAPNVSLVDFPPEELPTAIDETSGVTYGPATNFFAAATRAAAIAALEAYAAANAPWRATYGAGVSPGGPSVPRSVSLKVTRRDRGMGGIEYSTTLSWSAPASWGAGANQRYGRRQNGAVQTDTTGKVWTIRSSSSAPPRMEIRAETDDAESAWVEANQSGGTSGPTSDSRPHVQIAYRDGSTGRILREDMFLDSTAVWTTTGNSFEDSGQEEEEEVHAWIYTWVSDLGEEGPPSPPSDLLTRGYDAEGNIQSVTVQTATGINGPYGIATKRIYRTLTGTRGATSYQLVAEISATQASYTDSTLGSALGGDIISTLWDPPPDDLEGLIALPNGVSAGYTGRDVYFSEPYQPHAWPRDYVQALDDDVVGLGAYGTTLVVGTEGAPYMAVGSDPSTLRMLRMELDQACVAKRSFARAAGQGVLYSSPEGLVLIGPGGALLVSLPAYDYEGWQTLGPENLQGFYLDGNYVGFLADSAIAFDQESRSIITYADDITCGYEDQKDDRLYVVIGNRIMEWAVVRAPGDALREFTWRGRLETGGLRAYNTAQVIADDYPVYLKLIGDGEDLAWPDTVALDDQSIFEVPNRMPFRLPPDFGLHGNWELELTGANEIREVRIGTMSEMLG